MIRYGSPGQCPANGHPTNESDLRPIDRFAGLMAMKMARLAGALAVLA